MYTPTSSLEKSFRKAEYLKTSILADQSITLTTSAKILCGRAIALHAAVTMDTNTVSNDCTGAGDVGGARTDFGSLGFDDSAVTASVPEPSTIFLLGLGLIGLAGNKRLSTILARILRPRGLVRPHSA